MGQAIRLLAPFFNTSSYMSEIEEENNPGQQLNIELTEELAEGVYANLAMIGHSNTEFVVDFIRVLPGVPKAKVKSRIILTPEHAVRFLEALRENIERYEDQFGAIKVQPQGTPSAPFSFGGSMGQA